MHWHTGKNMPGYLPESEVWAFDTFEDAQESLAEDMLMDADAVSSWADAHNCDDIPCPTYGDDCPFQRGKDIEASRAELLESHGPGWQDYADGISYWIMTCDDTECEES